MPAPVAPNTRPIASLRLESARAATGKFVAVLGHYNPHTKELVIKRDEVQKHLSHGAQPSNTVIKLLLRDKVELPTWVKLKTKIVKQTEAPAEEAKSEDKAPEAKAEAEAPAIEATEEVRVAEVNEAAAGAAEDKAPDVDGTDTAASEAETAEKTK